MSDSTWLRVHHYLRDVRIEFIDAAAPLPSVPFPVGQNESSRIVITPAAPQISVFRNIRRIRLLSLSSVRPTASQMRPPGQRMSFIMGRYLLRLCAWQIVG